MLAEKRNNRPIKGLSAYKALSIETGRAAYPVSSLVAYCASVGLQIVVTDMAMQESYSVDSVAEIHDVLAMLMERYNETDRTLFQKTGVNYTKPKNGENTLSIKTLLPMLQHLSSKLDFIDKDN